MPLLHLALALERMGDTQVAAQARQRALTTGRGEEYLGDYGSPLRDGAAMLALLREQWPGQDAGPLTAQVSDALAHRRWLSTQEQLALLRLGAKEPAAPWQALIDGQVQGGEQGAELGLTAARWPAAISNQGAGNLYVSLLASGYPTAAPAPLSAGMTVTRSWFNADGQVLDPAAVRVGDLVVVRLGVQANQTTPDALLVEMLPAGFELENPALGQGVKLEDLKLAGKPAWQWEWNDYIKYQGFEDDRYVAALSLAAGSQRQLLYLMRAVTPGEYAVPLTQVEDMVRPERRALGGEGIRHTRIAPAQ